MGTWCTWCGTQVGGVGTRLLYHRTWLRGRRIDHQYLHDVYGTVTGRPVQWLVTRVRWAMEWPRRLRNRKLPPGLR